MSRRRDSSGGIIAVVSFAIFALLSSLLLLVSLVMGLGEMIGSTLLAMVLVGVLFALVAVVIYLHSLRAMFHEIGEQLNTIYEVASAAQSGYDWARNKLREWL